MHRCSGVEDFLQGLQYSKVHHWTAPPKHQERYDDGLLLFGVHVTAMDSHQGSAAAFLGIPSAIGGNAEDESQLSSGTMSAAYITRHAVASTFACHEGSRIASPGRPQVESSINSSDTVLAMGGLAASRLRKQGTFF